jgi:hypothetical protein
MATQEGHHDNLHEGTETQPARLFTDNHGQPISFYLSKSLPHVTGLKAKIEVNGGLIAKSDRDTQAIRIGDPANPIYLGKNYVSPAYIDDAISNGYKPNIEAYRIGQLARVQESNHDNNLVYISAAQSSAVRPASSIPSKGTGSRPGRVDFTLEDDELLKRIVHRPGVATSGNKIYKLIEQEYGRHSFHSWRDRYVRHLRPILQDPVAGHEADLEPHEATIVTESSQRKGKTLLQPDGTHKIARSSVPKQRSSSSALASAPPTPAHEHAVHVSLGGHLDPALSRDGTPDVEGLSTQASPAKSRAVRVPYTTADDDVLLAAVHRYGDHAKTYVALAKRHNNHTWQSWKERVKTLKRKNNNVLPGPPALFTEAESLAQYSNQLGHDADQESHPVADDDDSMQLQQVAHHNEAQSNIDPHLQSNLDTMGMVHPDYMQTVDHGDQFDNMDEMANLVQPGAYQLEQNSDLAGFHPPSRVFHINQHERDETMGPASPMADSDTDEEIAARRKKTKTVKKGKAVATPSKQAIKQSSSQQEKTRTLHEGRTGGQRTPTPDPEEESTVPATAKQEHHQKTLTAKKEQRSSQLEKPAATANQRMTRATRSVSVMSEDDAMAATQLQSGRSNNIIAEAAQKSSSQTGSSRDMPSSTPARGSKRGLVRGTPEPATPGRNKRARITATVSPPPVNPRDTTSADLEQALGEHQDSDVPDEGEGHDEDDLYSQPHMLGESQSLGYMAQLDDVQENSDEEEADDSSKSLAQRDGWLSAQVSQMPNLTQSMALRCWMAASGDEELAQKCIATAMRKRALPSLRGVWTDKEDEVVHGSDVDAITKVEKKHGTGSAMKRMQFLSKFSS